MSDGPKPWKAQCMVALARYYEAQAVVEGAADEREEKGLPRDGEDVPKPAEVSF